MEIPFVSLKQTTERIKDKFLDDVSLWLDKTHFMLDENVSKFEEQWAVRCGAKHCVGVSSGSDALYLALRTMGVGPGDEVITQGNAYNASVVSILRVGATPVFADVNDKTRCLDVDEVEKKITKKTKAILVVHLYGIVQDLSYLKGLGIPIVEDCAQAHGTTLQGDVACFSFYPTKTLGCFGDAGAVVTDDEDDADIIRNLRNLGQSSKNVHVIQGSTMRMDCIQAIAFLNQLVFFEDDLKERTRLAMNYAYHLGEPVSLDRNYYPHIFPYYPKDRDGLRRKLLKAGITTEVHYPTVVYRQEFYPYKSARCPNSEWMADHELSLPLFIGMTEEQQQYVIDSIKA